MQEELGHAEGREDPVPTQTVLIVEDDADIRDALVAILQDATSYQVIHVADGFAALKLVRTLIPQLVLLDYLLPGMDGLECLDWLRESKGCEQTPVILMSAAPPKGVGERPDLTFLEKPFEMDTLLTLIQQILEEN
ncbi:MAG TPA: response regulator [Ktedonobacteraceae bacterium]|nr:response regulator [Ktedonobacteraceae bacterium]